jgi:SAM-dependent methyltransferase
VRCVTLVAVTSKQLWLQTLWPRVRSWLPSPPATVVELGCGTLGGFVPALNADGYEAVGIDPMAPEGPGYRHVEFERAELPAQLQAVVACTSLHHVTEPSAVLDKVRDALGTGGLMVVVEWDWEKFDESTARWCLEREVQPDGWLRGRLDAWIASGQPWESYFRGWAGEHGLHSAPALIRELDRRFDRVLCGSGPYVFPELVHTTEADERRAIDAGEIRATRIDYVGRVG